MKNIIDAAYFLIAKNMKYMAKSRLLATKKNKYQRRYESIGRKMKKS